MGKDSKQYIFYIFQGWPWMVAAWGVNAFDPVTVKDDLTWWGQVEGTTVHHWQKKNMCTSVLDKVCSIIRYKWAQGLSWRLEVDRANLKGQTLGAFSRYERRTSWWWQAECLLSKPLEPWASFFYIFSLFVLALNVIFSLSLAANGICGMACGDASWRNTFDLGYWEKKSYKELIM